MNIALYVSKRCMINAIVYYFNFFPGSRVKRQPHLNSPDFGYDKMALACGAVSEQLPRSV
jgi:hypothetical protein